LETAQIQIKQTPIPVNSAPAESSVGPLEMVPTVCCLCETSEAKLVGSGRDFEYDSCADTFSAFQCETCGLVYLNPRPSVSEFKTIYPDSYHAFEFSEEQYGFVYTVRRRLEAKRLLSWCDGIGADAKILDIGCGDGFHLDLLAEFGKKDWVLNGVDMDERAVEICLGKGLDVFCGTLDDAGFEEASFDLAFTVQTVEHVAEPVRFLNEIRKLLKPGGRLIVVTDNTDSLDFSINKKSYWGGYHFPRHWNLFNRSNIKKLAERTGFNVESITTQVSPVNWTYSIRNMLVGKGSPAWIFDRFSLKSTIALSFFTALDTLFQLAGNGALLCARFENPHEDK
jgi:SAM-dependent methyltransferase